MCHASYIDTHQIIIYLIWKPADQSLEKQHEPITVSHHLVFSYQDHHIISKQWVAIGE